MSIWLQRSVSIQKRDSRLKFDHFRWKIQNFTASNLSTKVQPTRTTATAACGRARSAGDPPRFQLRTTLACTTEKNLSERATESAREQTGKNVSFNTCKATGRRELGFPGMRSTLLKLLYSLNKTSHNTLNLKSRLKCCFPSCTRPGKVVPLWTSPSTAKAFQSLVTR